MNNATKTGIATAAAAALGTAIYLAVPSAPVVPTIGLTWNCNYVQTNEVTVVVSSTNLLTPMSNWTVRLAAATNQCRLPCTNGQEFFNVYNTQK